jgi:hypothetical protein
VGLARGLDISSQTLEKLEHHQRTFSKDGELLCKRAQIAFIRLFSSIKGEQQQKKKSSLEAGTL